MEPWLGSHKVSELRQVPEHWLPSAASLADVRVRKYGGESRGTWGSADLYYYQPGDAWRAATAITEGRVDFPSVWRLNTPDGRLVEYGSPFVFRLGCLGLLAMVLSSMWMLVHELASS
ncbi:hypothetical protein [Streptomyces goshikiensis]|uniref:hypothetical protein n=1 Tax=Streptomyces goshikiensis TaxID=1942 RepID=UPI0036C2C318